MGSFAQQLRLPLPVGRLKILALAMARSAFFAPAFAGRQVLSEQNNYL